MAQSNPSAGAQPEGTVKADLHYVKRASDGTLPTPEDLYYKKVEFVESGAVDIHDVRDSKKDFSLKGTGFQYEKLAVPDDVDYSNNDSVTEKYLPVLEKFVKEQLGASAVKVFNHKVRDKQYGGDYHLDYSGPAIIPHVDITSDFAPLMFRGLAPELHGETTDNNKRWLILNAWKPLKTVRSDPLAVADRSSVGAEDLLLVPDPKRGAEVSSWFLQKGSGHNWWYMREQTPEDVLFFLQYDSDGGPAVPHTAFSLPDTADDTRESIEVRMIAVF